MRHPLLHLRRNAIAYLALFLALGTGGAYAASDLARNSVGTAQLKKGAVTSAKVKDGSLRPRDFAPGSLVAGDPTAGERGPRGETGPRGPEGSRGETGLAGAPGSARAYAYVDAGTSPSLDPARSRGFTSVTHAGTGTYCLTPGAGIDVGATAPLVTPVFNSGVLEPEFAEPSPNYDCAAGQLQVVTYLPGGPITLSDALDFTVALP